MGERFSPRSQHRSARLEERHHEDSSSGKPSLLRRPPLRQPLRTTVDGEPKSLSARLAALASKCFRQRLSATIAAAQVARVTGMQSQWEGWVVLASELSKSLPKHSTPWLHYRVQHHVNAIRLPASVSAELDDARSTARAFLEEYTQQGYRLFAKFIADDA